MKQVKLLIADDHPMVINGLEQLFSSLIDYAVVGSVGNGQEALDFLAEQSVDIVVLDVNMPIMNGLETAKKIKETYPTVKIIILTSINQQKLVYEMAEIGVDGCLLKGNSHDTIVSAINRVMDGKAYFDEVGDFDFVRPTTLLSCRELEVLKEYCKGGRISLIAETLSLSSNTIKAHLRNIRIKLNVAKGGDLARFAIREGLV